QRRPSPPHGRRKRKTAKIFRHSPRRLQRQTPRRIEEQSPMSDSFLVFGISPIIAVADVRSAVDFYVKHLGFTALFVAEDGSYGVAGLQNQSIHFVPAANEEALAATASNCSFRI